MCTNQAAVRAYVCGARGYSRIFPPNELPLPSVPYLTTHNEGMIQSTAPAAQRDEALREANRIHCRQTRERKRNQERLLREVRTNACRWFPRSNVENSCSQKAHFLFLRTELSKQVGRVDCFCIGSPALLFPSGRRRRRLPA